MSNVEFAHPSSHDWQSKAECSDEPHETFFIEIGQSSKPAREICERCPVQFECLLDSLEYGDRHGIFGGYTERERRTIKRDWYRIRESGEDSSNALRIVLDNLS